MVKKTKTQETEIPAPREMTGEEIQKMKKLADRIESSRGGLTELYTRYREMYFMEDESKPNWGNVDERDIAVTVSPSARNEVVGMVRLLDTSELHITVKSKSNKDRNSDLIESGLKTILRVSGEYRRARVESDAALSAVLYGPVTMYPECLDDLLEVNMENPYRKAQLEEVQRRTPFLIRTMNAEQSFPDWGEFGMTAHSWKREVRGSNLKETWGVECDVDKDYIVHDVYDRQFRLVYAEGINEPLLAMTHGMKRIPIVQRYAGGSSLFNKSEQQMQSFLYAKAKSRLDKRENSLLTAISTAINTRGLLGPLLSVNPENVPSELTIKSAGMVRLLVADAKQVDDKVIDPVVFEWKRLLDDLSGQSTIYKQTLGENISTSTFSGLAMLSSAGKLPMVDQQRAMEMAFRDIFLIILQRIKAESIDNDLIPAEIIPDDVELEVTFDPKLPQDQLRNASVATSLGNTVSKEWKHSELLQISDSQAMMKQVEKETLRDAILMQIIQNPETMKPFIMAALGMKQQQQVPAGGTHAMPDGTQMPDAQMPPAPPPAPPQMNTFGEGGGMMEQLPQTDAMIPPQERR